jgi:hypothetical protein
MAVAGIKIEKLQEFSDIESNILDIKENYISKVEKLSEKEGNIKGTFKEFFSETNAFRNKVYTELNKAENLLSSDFRAGPFSNNKEIKQIINKDYINAKKSFIREDEYLKKKISEIIYEKKEK